MDGVLHRQALGFHGSVQWTTLLISSLLLAPHVAAAAVQDVGMNLPAVKCEDPGPDAKPASNLLQIVSSTSSSSGKHDYFGPGRCVALKRASETGNCIFHTKCKDHNISKTEFAFICFNPGDAMPHALHSFGRGGFSSEEKFDTQVRCKTCISVDTAFKTGNSVMRNALAALPLSRLPSLIGAVHATGVYSIAELAQFKPKEAAVFGPDFCVSTFRAPAGTCLIRTRCAGVDLSKFNIGLTCLDQSGGYTRYLFGKDAFKAEETFDTLVTCEQCLGVGPESSQFAMHGLMPRKLVEDVNNLKLHVQTLSEKVRVLQESGTDFHEDHSDRHPSHHHDEDEKEERHEREEENDDIPPAHRDHDDKPDKPAKGMPSGPEKMPSAPKEMERSPQRANPEDSSEDNPLPPMPADDPNSLPPMPEDPNEGQLSTQSDPNIPTIMMSRRHRSHTPAAVVVEEAQEQLSEQAPQMNLGRSSEEVAEDSGAEMAAMEVGEMQVVTHRRGSAIAELLRRANA